MVPTPTLNDRCIWHNIVVQRGQGKPQRTGNPETPSRDRDPIALTPRDEWGICARHGRVLPSCKSDVVTT